MTTITALVLAATFLGLGLWHVWMAFQPSSVGESAGVPSVDGKSLFVPSRTSTLLVAAMLFLFAGLVVATAGIVHVPLPRVVLTWLSYALALGLLARAVGEFRYVGFFKRVRGSKFARMDTFVYSPACLALAAGTTFVAYADAI